MAAFIAFMVAVFLAVTGFVFYKQQAPASLLNGAENGLQRERGGSAGQTMSPLTTVNRSGLGLTSISKDNILVMGNVQQLDLSDNQLTGALPAEIRRLSDLEVLDISSNQMTGLPAELGQLSKLRILNASHNQLTGIPHELGNLHNLQILDLSGNDISEQDLQIIRSRLPASTQVIL